MLFYEDFVKKVEKYKVDNKKVKVYTLETKKVIILLSTSIPLILIGMLEGYIGYAKNFNLLYVAIALLLIYFGLKQLKKIFSYKITLDFKSQKIQSQGLDLLFDDIDSCILKEVVLGKGNKLQTVVRILTKEKKEVIIPLIMNKKLDFVCSLRNILKEQFSIEK